MPSTPSRAAKTKVPTPQPPPQQRCTPTRSAKCLKSNTPQLRVVVGNPADIDPDSSSDSDGSVYSLASDGGRHSATSDGSDAVSESSIESDSDDGSVSDSDFDTPRRKRARHSRPTTPNSGRSNGTPKKPQKTATLPKRAEPRTLPVDSLGTVRDLLHVSHVPDHLPGRESEFEQIYSFLASAVEKGGGECMYISGVPGTGKTATVRQAVQILKGQAAEEPSMEFKFVEINGMKLTDPNQAYCVLWNALYPGHPKVSPKHACDLLQNLFNDTPKDSTPIILMVDELDLLVTKKQTVIYNLFNWPRLQSSPLILLAIANTMDLPERVFSQKINSRVGAARLAFNAYTTQELALIIRSRLGGYAVLSDDAITFVTKKVAGMSGDARRALDICRKAIEVLEQKQASGQSADVQHVSRELVMAVVKDIFNPTVVPFIRNCSLHQKIFLLAIRKVARKTGKIDATFQD
ncbi:Origin recognition complex, subunit 1, partial [Entophlyctis luteolus]